MSYFKFIASVLSDKIVEGIELTIENNYLQGCKNVKICQEIEKTCSHYTTKQTFTISGDCEQDFDYLEKLVENLKFFLQKEFNEICAIGFC